MVFEWHAPKAKANLVKHGVSFASGESACGLSVLVLGKLKGGVRGKYHRQAVAGSNLMLIEPELVEVFPNAESVN